jgi:hypothetical protein
MFKFGLFSFPGPNDDVHASAVQSCEVLCTLCSELARVAKTSEKTSFHFQYDYG